MKPDIELIERMSANFTRRLIAERRGACWRGELSSSALSTATAAFALHCIGRTDDRAMVGGAVAWLANNQNSDGGWGDTIKSASNISTTLISLAAICAIGGERAASAERRAREWIIAKAGSMSADDISRAICGVYGKDRTFACPILAMCAIAGLFGDGNEAWRTVPTLPFELAIFPRWMFRMLRLHVVSYALPALIAIGQVREHFLASGNPIARTVRRLAAGPTLRLLEKLQPSGGGFLEAAPLTSFVTMSLASMGRGDCVVANRSAEFLRRTVRPDGSWPIDTDLATWVSTLSINAMGVEEIERSDELLSWLMGQQCSRVHPFTQSQPGGWAWTDLSGAVPDGDDTPGVLLAMRKLSAGSSDRAAIVAAARRGIEWLMDLQNSDGGIPTFCRGWGRLPFDRSCADLTAHAMAAMHAWRDDLPGSLRRRVDRAIMRCEKYLIDSQRSDGAWLPLWFGNEQAGGENPVYGTSRVVIGMLAAGRSPADSLALRRAAVWLVDQQNSDGGWGGRCGESSSIEETSLAIDAVCRLALSGAGDEFAGCVNAAVSSGVVWLADRTGCGQRSDPSPIGLYFASLWYYEKLYPMIFATSALRSAIDWIRSPKLTARK